MPELRPLMTHQEEGMVYGHSQTHAAWLLQMRLGKTLLTIRWYVSKGVKTVLIVAPVTVLEAWEKELTAEGETYVMLHGLSPDKREKTLVDVFLSAEKPDHVRLWVLMSYGGVRATPKVAQLPWDGAALDESTTIKNPTSQITKICTEGFNRTKHRCILTGLIAPESILDIFCQMVFAFGSFMGHTNFYKWRSEYFQLSSMRYQWIPLPGTRAKVKEAMDKKCFIRRRSEVNLGSKKIYQTRAVEMSPLQRKVYKHAENEFEALTENGKVGAETEYPMVVAGWLHRICGGYYPLGGAILCDNKLDELVSLLKGELRNESVMGWFAYNDEIAGAYDRLQKEGIKCDYLFGGMLRETRKAKLEALRQQKIQICLTQIKCVKFGVDASCCDTAIYMSNSWALEDRLQSEERIIHPMKKRAALFLDLVTKDTVDEDVVQALQDKTFDATWIQLRKKH